MNTLGSKEFYDSVDIKDLEKLVDKLYCAFDWELSPQGDCYWSDVANTLEGFITYYNEEIGYKGENKS